MKLVKINSGDAFMSKKDFLLKFVIDDDFSNNSIKKYLKDHNLTKKDLLYKVLNLLHDRVSLSINIKNEYRLNIINKLADLLSILCEDIELNQADIDLCKKKIKDIRNILSPFLKKSKNKALIYSVELLDNIKLDKDIDSEQLISFIIKLINNKESVDIIRKFYTNKSEMLENDDSIFDCVFRKTLEALRTDNPDIYYYITLLKMFCNPNIKKEKYLKELDDVSETHNIFNKEIYQIIHRSKDYHTCEEILDKYKINTHMPNGPIIYPKASVNNDRIITIDSTKTTLKDDGLSIKKDGNKFIVGIHIADGGKCIEPGSEIDLAAKNNFKCLYMENSTRTSMLSSCVEEKLSFKKGKTRPSITLNVVLNDSGDLIDYYITQNDIIVTDSLSYFESEKILNHVSTSDLEQSLSELFLLANTLEKRATLRDQYWNKKQENRITEKSRNTKSDIIVRQFMILYNILFAKIAKEEGIPFIFRTQDREYISTLINDMNIPRTSQIDKILEGIYLNGKYSAECAPHFGLGEEAYSHSSNPLRRYPDLYNQYLAHMFYFNDKKIDFDYDEFISFVEYANQRSIELSLLNAEFNKEAKLVRRKNS